METYHKFLITHQTDTIYKTSQINSLLLVANKNLAQLATALIIVVFTMFLNILTTSMKIEFKASMVLEMIINQIITINLLIALIRVRCIIKKYIIRSFLKEFCKRLRERISVMTIRI